MTQIATMTVEEWYAAGLRVAAARENMAVFGTTVRTPEEVKRRISPAWRATFNALEPRPIATAELAQKAGLNVNRVRKHLRRLATVGAALEGPLRPMPQGGFEKTWIKGKEPGQ